MIICKTGFVLLLVTSASVILGVREDGVCSMLESVYLLPNTSSNIASYYLCIRKVYESNVNKEATSIITNEGNNNNKKNLCFAFLSKVRFFNIKNQHAKN